MKNVTDESLKLKKTSEFQLEILHSWTKTLTLLAGILVPMFLILDFVTAPAEIMPKIIIYRSISTVLLLLQYLILRMTKPSKITFIHGYLVSIVVSFSISMMTVELGGFNSPYYAGLNLVTIGVNLLLPWGVFHSTMNGLIVLFSYLFLNFIFPHAYETQNLINNLYFLFSTVLLSVIFNHLHTKLIREQFSLRANLREARDVIWGEMKIAKRIQESLLPENCTLEGYSVDGFMKTAEEVGGDYYDAITTQSGESWINIGDVSGHGVESGLITMMAQTSVRSILNTQTGLTPSELLKNMNQVMKQNIDLLNVDRYLTFLSIKLKENSIQYSGKHLDMLVYRQQTKMVEIVETTGTWIGLTNNIEDYVQDEELPFEKGDVLLLYTDGVVEAMDDGGDLYGEDRLLQVFLLNVRQRSSRIIDTIISSIIDFQEVQMDDITLLVIKKN